MGRGKVQLRLIENGSSRKSVYRKRLFGLKKKAYELSKLCDVPSLVISIDSDGKVETFPENKDEVYAILKKYDSACNKVGEKYKKNSESMIQSEILKKQIELNQLRTENENMVSATVKFLDSMLMEIQGRILLQSYTQDVAFEEEVGISVDAGKLNKDKEFKEAEVEMGIEESARCNGHGDLPNFDGIEELLREIDASSDDMHDMQMATEKAGCHEHDDEFSVENLFKESDSSGGDMNDLQIVTCLAEKESDWSNVFSGNCNLFSAEDLFKGSDSSCADINDVQTVTHLAAEGLDQSNVLSGSCNKFLEHVPNSTCYADDDHPFLFELSDFIQF